MDYDCSITVLGEKPLVLGIELPRGVTFGFMAAAREFATAISVVQGKYPSRKFQFIPFSYSKFDDGTRLKSILAIAEMEKEKE